MKAFLKTVFLLATLLCLGALTLLSADAAVGTEAELQAAINAAGTSSGSATTITLTGNIIVSADGTFTVNGKNIVIDGAGYSIIRSDVATVGDYLFEITNGSNVELYNVTVENHVYTFRMTEGASSTLTLGAGTAVKGENPEGFVEETFNEPNLIYNGADSILTVMAGATVQKDSKVDARSVLVYTKGVLHVYGTLTDNTPGHNKNHRAVYAAGGTVNFYDGCTLTMANNGGHSNGTAMIWAGCTTLNIYGGTFTLTGWDEDGSPANLPHGMIALFGGATAVANISGGTFVMGASDKTAAVAAPLITSVSGGTLNITGGTFTQNYASPLFSTYSGTNLKELNITGGTFVQNGAANAFHITAGTTTPAITVGGNTKITNNHNTSSTAVDGVGRVFNFTVPATLTLGGTAEVTAYSSIVFSEGADITVTAKDSARLISRHAKGWVFAFYSGTSTLTLQDNVYVRAGTYDENGNSVGTDTNSYGVVLLERNSAGGGLTVNMSGNAHIESQNSGIFLNVSSETDKAKACVLNLTGGTVISHLNYAINLKAKTILTVTAIKNMTLDSWNACFNVESVTFTNATLAFENCSLTTRSDSAASTTVAAAIRIGYKNGTNVHTPSGLTSVTLTNCNVETPTQLVSIGTGITTVKSIKVRTTGAGSYTLKGAINCAAKNGSDPTAVTTFSIEGTGTVTLNGVTVTQPATVNTITVKGTGTLTLTDCSFTQTGAAAALMKVSAAATVNVGGSTLLSNTAADRTYPAIFLAANAKLNIYGTAQIKGVDSTSAISMQKCSPTVHISGNVQLTSNTYTVSIQGGSPVITVEGGTLLGSYVVVYKNTGDYLTAGGFITVNVSGGTLSPDLYSAFYISSDDAAPNKLNISGGTFTAPVSTNSTNKYNNTISAVNGAVVQVKISGGDFTDADKLAAFASFATSKVAVEITGGTFAGTLTSTAAGTSLTVTVKGGKFGTAAAGVGFTGSAAKVNVYSGYFESSKANVVSVSGGAVLTVYGGTFHKATSEAANLLHLGEGGTAATVNIKGGVFRSEATTVPMVLGANELVTLRVESCSVWGKTNFITNHGKGAVSFTQNNINYSDINSLVMKGGSTLRLIKGSAGLRFVTNISKAAYDHYAAIADGGKLTFGTLIMPAQYLAWAKSYKGEYTRDALDALSLQYLDIVSTATGFHQNEDGSYTMNAAIANIREENEQLSFAALSYVTYTVGGITVTQYSNYNNVKHVRNIYQVARAAANDVSVTEQGDYVNQIEAETLGNGNSAYVGQYSRYTAEQWNMIAEWWVWNNTTKNEVKTLDIFMIAGQSNGAGYGTVTDAFRTTYGSKTYPNIYFSGGVSSYVKSNVTLSDGTTTSSINKLGNPRENLPGTTTVKIGLGKSANHVGAEIGIAEMLSSHYNAQTGRTAAIVKYAVGGTSLTDDLTKNKNNKMGGNWCPPSYLAEHGRKGEESGMLYRSFILRVESAVEDYRAMGYIVEFRGMYWLQGVNDRNFANITTTYPQMFKALIGDVRAACKAMTPNKPDTVIHVVLGENAKTPDAAQVEANNKFIAMQNTLPNYVDKTYVVKTSHLDPAESDQSHWGCDQQTSIGRMVGYLFMTKALGITGLTKPTVK